MDVSSNGQMNASARLVRVCIGEPDKFYVPISVYGGVSNTAFPSGSPGPTGIDINLHGLLISPLSGTFNVCFDEVFFRHKTPAITKFGLICQMGERLLTGYRLSNDRYLRSPVHLLNTVGALGCLFQTGAWERSGKNDMGICWFAVRHILSYSPPKSLSEILPDAPSNGFSMGLSVGVGLEINKLVSIKTVCYQYLKSSEKWPANPTYQFSFNYTLKQ